MNTQNEYIGYINPMTSVIKECPICETKFESPRYQGKQYCSLRCRRRAKNFRETTRYKALGQSVKPDSPFFMVIPNPTIEQLDRFAKLVLGEQTNDKPIKATGLIPANWSPPEGLIWNKQQKLNDTDADEWIMFHPAMIDNLLTSTAPNVAVEIEKPKRSAFRTKQILDNL